MREITKYIAEDGTEFNSMDACLCYENNIMDAIKTISGFCSSLDCEDCAFHCDGGLCQLRSNLPEDWASLADEIFNRKNK